jgi:hypothetical protein
MALETGATNNKNACEKSLSSNILRSVK